MKRRSCAPCNPPRYTSADSAQFLRDAPQTCSRADNLSHSNPGGGGGRRAAHAMRGDLVPSPRSGDKLAQSVKCSRVGGTIVGTLARPTVPHKDAEQVEILFRPSFHRAFVPSEMSNPTHESATVPASFYDELIHAVLTPATTRKRPPRSHNTAAADATEASAGAYSLSTAAVGGVVGSGRYTSLTMDTTGGGTAWGDGLAASSSSLSPISILAVPREAISATLSSALFAGHDAPSAATNWLSSAAAPSPYTHDESTWGDHSSDRLVTPRAHFPSPAPAPSARTVTVTALMESAALAWAARGGAEKEEEAVTVLSNHCAMRAVFDHTFSRTVVGTVRRDGGSVSRRSRQRSQSRPHAEDCMTTSTVVVGGAESALADADADAAAVVVVPSSADPSETERSRGRSASAIRAHAGTPMEPVLVSTTHPDGGSAAPAPSSPSSSPPPPPSPTPSPPDSLVLLVRRVGAMLVIDAGTSIALAMSRTAFTHPPHRPPPPDHRNDTAEEREDTTATAAAAAAADDDGDGCPEEECGGAVGPVRQILRRPERARAPPVIPNPVTLPRSLGGTGGAEGMPPPPPPPPGQTDTIPPGACVPHAVSTCRSLSAGGRESVYDGYSHILRLDTGKRLVFVGMMDSPVAMVESSEAGKGGREAEEEAEKGEEGPMWDRDGHTDMDRATTVVHADLPPDRSRCGGAPEDEWTGERCAHARASTTAWLVDDAQTHAPPHHIPRLLRATEEPPPPPPPPPPPCPRPPGLSATTRDTLSCWFDATLSHVPHVAVYRHRAGDVLAGCEMKRVKELLEPREKAMADVGLQFLLDVLEWLVRHCVRESKTYIVVGGGGSEYLELYEVPAEVEQRACPAGSGSGSGSGGYSPHGQCGTDGGGYAAEGLDDDAGSCGQTRYPAEAKTARTPTGRNGAHGWGGQEDAATASRAAGGGRHGDASASLSRSDRSAEELNISLARMCLGMTRHLLFSRTRPHRSKPDARGVKDLYALLLRSFMVFIQHMHHPPLRQTLYETVALLPRLVHRTMLLATRPRAASAAAAKSSRRAQSPPPPLHEPPQPKPQPQPLQPQPQPQPPVPFPPARRHESQPSRPDHISSSPIASCGSRSGTAAATLAATTRRRRNGPAAERGDDGAMRDDDAMDMAESVIQAYEGAREVVEAVESGLWRARRGVASGQTASRCDDGPRHTDEDDQTVVVGGVVHTLHRCLACCVHARLTLIAWALRGCVCLSAAHVRRDDEEDDKEEEEEEAAAAADRRRSDETGAHSGGGEEEEQEEEENGVGEVLTRLLCRGVCAGLQAAEESLWALQDSVTPDTTPSTASNAAHAAHSSAVEHRRHSDSTGAGAGADVDAAAGRQAGGACRALVDPRATIPWPALRGMLCALHGDVIVWVLRHATAAARENIDGNGGGGGGGTGGAGASRVRLSPVMARMHCVTRALHTAAMQPGRCAPAAAAPAADTAPPRASMLQWLGTLFAHTTAATAAGEDGHGDTTRRGKPPAIDCIAVLRSLDVGALSMTALHAYARAAMEGCEVRLQIARVHLCMGSVYRQHKRHTKALEALQSARQRLPEETSPGGGGGGGGGGVYPRTRGGDALLDDNGEDDDDDDADAMMGVRVPGVGGATTTTTTTTTTMTTTTTTATTTTRAQRAMALALRVCVTRELGDSYTDLVRARERLQSVMHTAITATVVINNRAVPPPSGGSANHRPAESGRGGAAAALSPSPLTTVTPTSAQPLCVGPCRRVALEDDERFIRAALEAYGEAASAAAALTPLFSAHSAQLLSRVSLHPNSVPSASSSSSSAAAAACSTLVRWTEAAWIHEAVLSSRAARQSKVRMLLTLVGAQLDRQLRRGQPLLGGLCAQLYQFLREIKQSGPLLWGDAAVPCRPGATADAATASVWTGATQTASTTTTTTTATPPLPSSRKPQTHKQRKNAPKHEDEEREQKSHKQLVVVLQRLRRRCPTEHAGAWELLRLFTTTACEAAVPEEMRAEVAMVTSAWTREVRRCWRAVVKEGAEPVDLVQVHTAAHTPSSTAGATVSTSGQCGGGGGGGGGGTTTTTTRAATDGDPGNPDAPNVHRGDDGRDQPWPMARDVVGQTPARPRNGSDGADDAQQAGCSVATVTEWCVQLALVHCVALERATAAVGTVNSSSANTARKSAARRVRGRATNSHARWSESDEEASHVKENKHANSNKSNIHGGKKNSKNAANASSSKGKNGTKGDANMSQQTTTTTTTTSINAIDDSLSGDDVIRRVADMAMLLSIALTGKDQQAASGAGTMYACWRLHAMMPWVCVMTSRMMQRALRLAMARLTEPGLDDDADELLDRLAELEKTVMPGMITATAVSTTPMHAAAAGKSGAKPNPRAVHKVNGKDVMLYLSDEVAQSLRELLQPLMLW